MSVLQIGAGYVDNMPFKNVAGHSRRVIDGSM